MQAIQPTRSDADCLRSYDRELRRTRRRLIEANNARVNAESGHSALIASQAQDRARLRSASRIAVLLCVLCCAQAVWIVSLIRP